MSNPHPKAHFRAAFAIADTSENDIVIVDLDGPVSVTNNAEAVVAFLHRILPGGLNEKQLFYRDTQGRFDELKVKNGAFDGFAPCSPAQNEELYKRCAWVSLPGDVSKRSRAF